MTQTTLFDSRLDAEFAEYHRANPQIFELFRRFSRRVKDAGLTSYGAKAIMERIRWEIVVEASAPISSQHRFRGWKVNNNYTSRYVRLLEEECPEFEGFFRKRTLKG